jgi:hypothetical protein
MKRFLTVAVCVLVLGGACRRLPARGAEASAVDGKTAVVDETLLRDLSLVALGVEPSAQELGFLRGRIQRGELKLDEHVRMLVKDPRFGQQTAPRILLGQFAMPVLRELAMMPMMRAEPDSAGKVVHFVREPCASNKAEKVRPWWAMDTEILVCPDAHQPTHIVEPKTGWRCGAYNLNFYSSTYCGCGPNLIYCTADGAHRDALAVSAWNEVADTIAEVVNEDRPIAQVFTSNETVRDRNAESFYQMWRVTDGQLRNFPVDVSGWPAQGKKGPRHDGMLGQNAGILSTPFMVFLSDTQRARMRDYFEVLWCTPPESSGVTTETIFGLGAANLREGEGWRKLATKPVCENCHARLDFGMQFFPGFPDTYRSQAITAKDFKAGQGPLYAMNAKDPRGAAVLTPVGFANLATAAPEFSACMVERVGRHVFGGELDDAGEQELAEAFQKHPTLQTLMEVALRRYAHLRLTSVTQASSRSYDAALPSTEGVVVLSSKVQALLEQECTACHGEDDVLSLQGGSLPKTLVPKLIEQVAFGRMPKNAFMSSASRRVLVESLLPTVSPDDVVLGKLQDFYLTGMRASRVHDRPALLARLAAVASIRFEGERWPGNQEEVDETLSPQFALGLALSAAAACEKAGGSFEACIAKATEPAAVLKLGAHVPQ